MATSAAEASSSCSFDSNPRWQYQVFLSFRGEDTRRGFTDHLYASLQRRGITTFRDDRQLGRGEVISSELLKAIEGSMFAIIVLSPNYAFSSWCLDELQKIIECREFLGQSVFPIFYGVDPSDVRHQRGLFAEAFRKHEEKFQGDKEKLQRWRDVLKEIANISGWDSKDRHEAEIIESIVDDIQRKLLPRLPSFVDNLVGIDSRVEKVNSLLGVTSNEVRFIGIWGMGGIGKTTIARVVFERIQVEFEGSCFLTNVREDSATNGMVNVQRQFLSRFPTRSIDVYDVNEGKKIIKNLLCNRKVLLVLDDVSELSQLENLAGKQDWFGPGSRVVVTTRDKHLLIAHGIYKEYEVVGLNRHEARKLFCRKTFKKDQPEEGYLDLSNEVVEYAGGLPLAIEVLGSFLCGRTVDTWHSALKQIKNVPDPKILDTLKISYDALRPWEKNMFLDIACFFKGMDKDQVIEILEKCGLCPGIGIETLIEKSLVTLSFNKLWMHDLIQEMGRNIVFEESPCNPGRRSRLWSHEDIDHVLVQNKGTEAIQGIILDLPQHYVARWNSEAFSKTSQLKLLKFCNIQLPLGLTCLPGALRVLEWGVCPLKTLPLNIQLDELVDLKMLHSEIERLWYGKRFLGNLKFIDLSFSKNLTRSPNISGVPNLERLVLKGCTGLVEVHASLGFHKKLVLVDFEGCEGLKTLPSEMEMSSIQDLILSGCSKVKKLPEFGESMGRLLNLSVEGTSITKLPQSLGRLIRLAVLSLKHCKNLAHLPSTISNLKSLEILNISGCSKLSSLPEGLKEINWLKILDASETAIEEPPSFIFNLENLKELSFGRCKGPVSKSKKGLLFRRHPVCRVFKIPCIRSLRFLQCLNLSYCNLSEGSLPDDIGCLSSLRSLDLTGNNFVSLPSTISELSKLEELYLNCCWMLQSLPELPSAIERLYASNCTALETSSFDLSKPCNLLAATKQITENDAGSKKSGLFFRTFVQETPVPKPRFDMIIPGSVIPSWFNINSVGPPSFDPTLTLELPPNWRSTYWVGFALCFVLKNCDDSEVCNHQFYCYYEECGSGKPRIPIVWPAAPHMEPHQPHLYVIYLSGDEIKAKAKQGREIEFSLRTKCCSQLEITKSGCRLLYEGDVEDWKKTGDNPLKCRSRAAGDMR